MDGSQSDFRTAPASDDSARHARTLGALALLYHRHGDPARALALGLAAMRLAPPAPRLVLLLASTFLRTGDPDQALAALGRLDGGAPGLVASAPGDRERAAADVLRAKALFRKGDGDAAREALARGRAAFDALRNGQEASE